MATHLDAAALVASNCLCFRARRVSRLITRMYADALRPLGLEPTQLTLLCAIALIGRRAGGGAPLTDIGDTVALELSTVSRTVRGLTDSGLVRLGAAEHDGRVRLASLTPAGERMLLRAEPVWADAHEQLVDALGGSLADQLHRVLDRTAGAASPEPAPAAL